MSKYLVRLGALLATAIGGFSHSVHVYAEGATIPTSDVIVGSTPVSYTHLTLPTKRIV